MAGEFDFISWLRQHQPASTFVPIPAGDDLAALNWPAGDLVVVGVDQVLDGVHFDASQHSPTDIGRKAMNRNLSDCAAMGALPAAAVITFALPLGVGTAYARELYLGVKAAGDAFNCAIVGGDTGSWPGKLVVTVTILGRSAGVTPVTRRGAKVGDGLYVSGALGGSILGRHLSFTPRVQIGRRLAIEAGAHAMIDLSDGLSRDAGHLARESGVGVEINAELVPIHEEACRLSERDGLPALEHALHDGEDYELLAALPASVDAIATAIGMRRIGSIVSEPGVWLRQAGERQSLTPKAWEHSL